MFLLLCIVTGNDEKEGSALGQAEMRLQKLRRTVILSANKSLNPRSPDFDGNGSDHIRSPDVARNTHSRRLRCALLWLSHK